MILFFSATGNTEFIAKELARALDDDCLNLLERIKRQDNSALHSEKPFVILSPVYVCEMPLFLRDFLKRQTFSGSRDVYVVFTSGGYAGISGVLAKRLFRRKGMRYRGHAELQMPRNYIVSNHYPELEEAEIRRRIREARRQIPRITAQIRRGRKLRSRHVFLFELAITLPFHPIWVRLRQPSKSFFSTTRCVGCGKCAQVCPLNNIRIAHGRPIWQARCAHCMACISNCPVEAIEYARITQTKKKYHIKKILSKKWRLRDFS